MGRQTSQRDKCISIGRPGKGEDHLFGCKGVYLPATIALPSSPPKSLVLGGAGVRSIEIGGQFFMAATISIYLEEEAAVLAIAEKWKGKSVEELSSSVEFYQDIAMYGSFSLGTMIFSINRVEDRVALYFDTTPIYPGHPTLSLIVDGSRSLKCTDTTLIDLDLSPSTPNSIKLFYVVFGASI